MPSRMPVPLHAPQVVLAVLGLAMTAGLVGACGGEDSRSETSATESETTETEQSTTAAETPEETAEPTEEVTDLARWTGEVCAAAIAFQDSTSSFSDDINAVDLGASDAKEQVLTLYAGFADSLQGYAADVEGLDEVETPGGAAVRQTWVDALALAIEQNAEVVGEVEALDAETFGPAYTDLIVNWGDDFSDHDLRGQINALIPEYPEVQTEVIDVVDNTDACAEAAF